PARGWRAQGPRRAHLDRRDRAHDEQRAVERSAARARDAASFFSVRRVEAATLLTLLLAAAGALTLQNARATSIASRGAPSGAKQLGRAAQLAARATDARRTRRSGPREYACPILPASNPLNRD